MDCRGHDLKWRFLKTYITVWLPYLSSVFRTRQNADQIWGFDFRSQIPKKSPFWENFCIKCFRRILIFQVVPILCMFFTTLIIYQSRITLYIVKSIITLHYYCQLCRNGRPNFLTYQKCIESIFRQYTSQPLL